mmetsp:Transcript_66883/g.148488  ORF Transcript_66883/g.148488 Transcript_66883/m.148488 type:complete len:285 (-) Transcript_66883:378-1232(-)
MVTSYMFQFFVLLARSGQGYNVVLYAAYFLVLIPYILVVYLLRKNFAEKQRLIAQLQKFDLDQVQCTEEFDRKFIHTAITKWYGSKKAFAQHVRTTLCQELLASSSSRVPLGYLVLMLTPVMGGTTELFLAQYMGGAPFDSLLSYAIAIFIGVNFSLLTACTILFFYLCDRFPRRGGDCSDQLQFVAILLLVFSVQSAGVVIASWAYRTSLMRAVAFALAAFVLLSVVLWFEQRVVAECKGCLPCRQKQSLGTTSQPSGGPQAEGGSEDFQDLLSEDDQGVFRL